MVIGFPVHDLFHQKWLIRIVAKYINNGRKHSNSGIRNNAVKRFNLNFKARQREKRTEHNKFLNLNVPEHIFKWLFL